MDVLTAMKTAESGLKLLAQLERVAGKKIESSLLRMVYLELCLNLEVLNAVSLDRESRVPASDLAYAKAADALSTQSIYALVVALEEPGLLERLLHRSVNLMELDVETGREREHSAATPLPQAARFLYVKITALQGIARLDDRIRGELRLRTRLRNIQTNTKVLERALAQLDPVQAIARNRDA